MVEPKGVMSLRHRWQRAYPEWPLKHGIRQGIYDVRPRMIPYRSLRRLLRAALWPEGGILLLGPKARDPDNYTASWTNKAQGITTSETDWYITTWHSIFRIPLSMKLGAETLVSSLPLKNKHGVEAKHAGALVYAKGYLYVPIEEHGDGQI